MPEQPAYRSPWAKDVGGAALPSAVPQRVPAFRSFLWYFGGGGAKPVLPPSYAGPRSLLAFWIGGAALNYDPNWRPTPPPFELVTSKEGGLPFGRRPFIDDDEVNEFLRLWVAWNDVE